MCDPVKSDRPITPANSNVRSEYLRLPGDLLELAAGFKLHLAEDCQRDAANLVFAIECVDRMLDSLPDASDRAKFAAYVLGTLADSSLASNDPLAPELSHRLVQLHEMIHRRNIVEPFRRITGRILRNAEQMRATRRPAFYVRAAVWEGRWMVELLLLILGDGVTPRFRAFLRQVAGPANLSDKLRDARGDFALGELAIKPGISFYLRLTGGMLWRILALAVRFCADRKILTWGLKSLYHELALPRHRTA